MPWDSAETQAALGKLAHQLLAVRDQLKTLGPTIPETTDEEDEGPWTMHGELRGIVECAADDLEDIIQTLQEGATLESGALQQKWREWKRRDDRFWRKAAAVGLFR